MLSVSGARSVIDRPYPGRLTKVTLPPRRSTLARTTSNPTPRPEIVVTRSAVETPAVKISAAAADSSSSAARAGSISLDVIAFCTSAAVSIPRPSSTTSMLT